MGEKNLNDDNTFAKEALLCEIGVKLQQARESKGLSKEQVVKELKLSKIFLEALESGEWEKMPGEVYALGFFRQYADLLNLDVTEDIQKIKTSTYELTVPLTYPDAPISPNRTWVVSAVLLFFMIIIIMNLLDFESEKVAEKQIEHEQQAIQPVQSPYAELNVSGETADLTAKVIVHDAPSFSGSDQGEELKAVIQQENHSGLLQTYTFSAVSDDAWLQVYQETEGQEHELLREVLLRKGESFQLESRHLLLLTSGKPTALKVERDGAVLFETGELGQEDKVLKLFPLN